MFLVCKKSVMSCLKERQPVRLVGSGTRMLARLGKKRASSQYYRPEG
jgi:hypothetical protein